MDSDESVVDLSVGFLREREALPQGSILLMGLPSTLEIRPVPMERSQPQDLTRTAPRQNSGLEITAWGRGSGVERDRTPLSDSQATVTPREMPAEERMDATETRKTRHPRRSLRPCQERSYAESPDVFILSDDEPRTNGFSNGFDIEYDSDEELPPLPSPPIKELNGPELEDRERGLRKLREELQNEEMKLVLLKKLKQSQEKKENIAVLPEVASKKMPPPTAPPPLTRTPKPATALPQLREQPTPSRHSQPLSQQINSKFSSNACSLPPNILLAQQLLPKGTTLCIGSSRPLSQPGSTGLSFTPTSGRDSNRKEHSSPSTPTTPQPERKQEEHQSLAQRQAAAKRALRKQFEKTLVQIPPPKPPPAETLFIPDSSSTEFVYLVGLDYIVDFITKDQKNLTPPEPFRCAQCLTDFTPVWKWEKGSGKNRELKVICEKCVTTNLKKSLKAEHINRLKIAFVKAVQQEQEIEQRLAQIDFRASPQPKSRKTPPAPSPKQAPAAAPISVPSTPKSNPTPSRATSTTTFTTSSLSSNTSKFNQHPSAAATALQQQLLWGHQPLPAHMLPFYPLCYPYQLGLMPSTSTGMHQFEALALPQFKMPQSLNDAQGSHSQMKGISNYNSHQHGKKESMSSIAMDAFTGLPMSSKDSQGLGSFGGFDMLGASNKDASKLLAGLDPFSAENAFGSFDAIAQSSQYKSVSSNGSKDNGQAQLPFPNVEALALAQLQLSQGIGFPNMQGLEALAKLQQALPKEKHAPGFESL